MIEFRSFGDELVKIAFFNTLRRGFSSALKAGWHGTPHNPVSALPGKGWLGTGAMITPDMGATARGFEHMTSLGGATKYLPVGPKSLMVLGAGLEAKEALKSQDPAGLQRSRAERLTGAAGNLGGGLLGAGAMAHLMPRSTVFAPVVGGVLGSAIASRAASAPFQALRRWRRPSPVAAQPQEQVIHNPGTEGQP